MHRFVKKKTSFDAGVGEVWMGSLNKEANFITCLSLPFFLGGFRSW